METSNPDNLVSVVISNYNRAPLLKRAVQSVLLQTHDHLEIIICDDGSTDESQVLIKASFPEEFASEKITWMDCGKNGGPAIPRNHGIQKSRGKWIAFLDNDDYWAPTKISRQLELLHSGNGNVCCTNAYVINATGDQNIFFSKALRTPITWKNLWSENLVICSSVLASKDHLLATGGFPIEKKFHSIEDYALWLKLSTMGSFIYCDEPFVYYTDSPQDSIRHREIEKKDQSRSLVHQHFIQWARSRKNGAKWLFLHQKNKVEAWLRTKYHAFKQSRSMKLF